MNVLKLQFKSNTVRNALLGSIIALLISACATQPSTEEADTCVAAGYFRSSFIVGGYYRCVWSEVHARWLKTTFNCPSGKEFNENTKKCE